jgi:hypothetical protein
MAIGLGRWVLAACSLSVAGCVLSSTPIAVQRASREFGCPVEKVGMIPRSDIASSVYDVAACGQRARYSCFWLENGAYLEGNQLLSDGCAREPDPPKWDPDPAAVASLPGHPAGIPYGQPWSQSRNVCADATQSGCIYRDDAGAWQWRPLRPRLDSFSYCGSGMICDY